jgi:hypothetical protein
LELEITLQVQFTYTFSLQVQQQLVTYHKHKLELLEIELQFVLQVSYLQIGITLQRHLLAYKKSKVSYYKLKLIDLPTTTRESITIPKTNLGYKGITK